MQFRVWLRLLSYQTSTGMAFGSKNAGGGGKAIKHSMCIDAKPEHSGDSVYHVGAPAPLLLHSVNTNPSAHLQVIAQWGLVTPRSACWCSLTLFLASAWFILILFRLLSCLLAHSLLVPTTPSHSLVLFRQRDFFGGGVLILPLALYWST